jgi:hypothetical protein
LAKHVMLDVSLVVNGVNLSDHVESVSFILTTNKQPAAAMGDLIEYSMPGTKAIEDLTINFYQDFAAAKVYATLTPAWEARSTFNLVVKPESGAISATNPQWTFPVFVASQPLLSGTRGERNMASVTLAVAGNYTIATA